MTTIHRRTKPLSVSPLKASQTIGAALAFLGVERAVPLMHGAQGCTAFGKVFFVRHFREPIPLQTTAMDQISSVMGADENIVEGLRAVCSKQSPSLVGLPTTGLAETQGADIHAAVKAFRERYPEYAGVRVVPVNTPDYSGCFESGYAAAVRAMIEVLVPENRSRPSGPLRRRGQVNVLAGSLLSVGDIEGVKELVEAFGLSPVVLPDLAESLDGHLADEEFNPLTYGGASVAEIETMGEADATLVLGRSLGPAADLLRERTDVPDFRFDHLFGLEACDAFIYALHRISGAQVPRKIERQRAQLQDAMVDTHFTLGQTRCAVALDSDLLLGYSQFLAGMGAEVVAAVAPAAGPALQDVAAEGVTIGDLEDLEKAARAERAEIVLGNSHAVELSERLHLPILRAGFPQYDWIGGYATTRAGYRGTRQMLFDLANLLGEGRHHRIHPYHSKLSQKRDGLPREANHHDSVEPRPSGSV
jgi:nitrogenase molybdenum-iron protein NifN